jgi:thioredoxin reductase
MSTTAIIGSGMGGLVAGNLLAKKGHKVTLFESFPSEKENLERYFADVNDMTQALLILPNDLSFETGELTPTLKTKRKLVKQKHEPGSASLF